LRPVPDDRLTLLEAQLATVNRVAAANELPDAIITESGLKITPLDAAVPDTAQALINQTAMICLTSRSPNCCSKWMSGRASPGTLRT
jgi:hypothetical protein